MSAPIAARTKARPTTGWMTTAVVIALLVLSLLIRVRNLSSPLTEDHAFRQTQTAITVWTFVAEGIHPLAYETPIFGPPWRVPLEFPVFQIAAAGLVRAGVRNIDVASRVTSLLFFYLSAWLLYALCRLHIESRSASVSILLAYVWLPFAIFWSRTSMIDYASVASALAYLYCLSRWLTRERASDLALAIASGCLLYLIKLTTQPTVIVAILWLTWERLRDDGGVPILRAIATHKGLLIGLAAALVVPLAVGLAWTDYADRIRHATPATEWLSANRLTSWNFGTWDQRLDWSTWSVILERLESTCLPGTYLIFGVLGLWRAGRDRARAGAFVLAMALGAVAAIAIFFNLYYQHNYYLMAVTPAIAIVAGFGFDWLCFELVRSPTLRWPIALAVLCMWQWNARPYLASPFSVSYNTDLAFQVGRAIADVSTPDERIVIEGHDWSPDFLYYARRKGLMWRGSVVEMPDDALAKLLASDRFTTLVCFNHQSNAARFWRQRRLVRQVGAITIYKVSD